MTVLTILAAYLAGMLLTCGVATFRRAHMSFGDAVWGHDGPFCLVWMFWPLGVLSWLIMMALRAVYERANAEPKPKKVKPTSVKCANCQGPAPKAGVYR